MDKDIARIFSDEHKLALWQRVELAAIEAQVRLGQAEEESFLIIKGCLESNPIDIAEWERLDAEMGHDLNAFVAERRRFIPDHLQYLWHRNMTSYDTEEPAFALMLAEAMEVLKGYRDKFVQSLEKRALQYQYLPMMARSHGQHAELQSFGMRFLRPVEELKTIEDVTELSLIMIQETKMSGAVGNYTGNEPEWERLALQVLGLVPCQVASQIVPRSKFETLALSVAMITGVANKVALDIRLNSRSGNPLCHEPFGKKQTGSSAMPGKKNPINGEQMEGMLRMAKGYLMMIIDNMTTWEERAIEQSCVERVAWPDLFHVTANSLKKMTKVVDGLVVYEGNILREITDTHGGYAQSEAKEQLKRVASGCLSAEECYQIIQLALFNIADELVAPKPALTGDPSDLTTCFAFVEQLATEERRPYVAGLMERVLEGTLVTSPQLGHDSLKVIEWNRKLVEIFAVNGEAEGLWKSVFSFEYLLRNEPTIYTGVLMDLWN
jgi:adenylosuccinate lyase